MPLDGPPGRVRPCVGCSRRAADHDDRWHVIEQRLSRWLLITHDRVQADQFEITQEFLSQMLGVHRKSVTVAASNLQRAGLIRYSRGKLKILDREGLEAASCECYRALRRQFNQLLMEIRADR